MPAESTTTGATLPVIAGYEVHGELGRGPLLVVPGIRLPGAASHDQRRTGTPAAALHDAVARDPAQPRRLRPEFDVGDHLHLNPAGYAALAATVPAGLFRNGD